jgi:hypothetical protein
VSPTSSAPSSNAPADSSSRRNWDTCLEEILPAVTSGAALVFHAGADAGSPPRLLRTIAAERISVLDLPTAFWRELVHHLGVEPRSRGERPRSNQPGMSESTTYKAATRMLVNSFNCV